MKNFSWVLPQRLAVGPFPGSDHEISYLCRIGVTAVLCLTQEKEARVPAEIRNRFVWERVPMPDGARGGIPKVGQFDAALDLLDRWLARKHVVYVHCLAGIGRSPSVCAAYIAESQGADVEEAVAFVRDRHPAARPDSHQIRTIGELLTGSHS